MHAVHDNIGERHPGQPFDLPGRVRDELVDPALGDSRRATGREVEHDPIEPRVRAGADAGECGSGRCRGGRGEGDCGHAGGHHEQCGGKGRRGPSNCRHTDRRPSLARRGLDFVTIRLPFSLDFDGGDQRIASRPTTRTAGDAPRRSPAIRAPFVVLAESTGLRGPQRARGDIVNARRGGAMDE